MSAVSRNSKAIGEELLKTGGGDLLASLLSTPGRNTGIIVSWYYLRFVCVFDLLVLVDYSSLAKVGVLFDSFLSGQFS